VFKRLERILAVSTTLTITTLRHTAALPGTSLAMAGWHCVADIHSHSTSQILRPLHRHTALPARVLACLPNTVWASVIRTIPLTWRMGILSHCLATPTTYLERDVSIPQLKLATMSASTRILLDRCLATTRAVLRHSMLSRSFVI